MTPLKNPPENLMIFFQFVFWTLVTFLKKQGICNKNILLKFVIFEFVRNFAQKNLIYK
jgi:hypothetical protein